MRSKYTKVRARSANEGSGTLGWSLGPVPACFLMDDEDIGARRNQLVNSKSADLRVLGVRLLLPAPASIRFDSSARDGQARGETNGRLYGPQCV